MLNPRATGSGAITPLPITSGGMASSTVGITKPIPISGDTPVLPPIRPGAKTPSAPNAPLGGQTDPFGNGYGDSTGIQDRPLVREFQNLVREQDLRRDLERIQDRNDAVDRERRLNDEQLRHRDTLLERMHEREAMWQKEFASQQLAITEMRAATAREIDARRTLESQLQQLTEAVRVQQEALIAAKTHVDTSAAAFGARLREVETALVVDGRALADAVRMRAVTSSTEGAILRKQFADLQTALEQRLSSSEQEARELRRENMQLKGDLEGLHASFSQLAIRSGLPAPPRPLSSGNGMLVVAGDTTSTLGFIRPMPSAIDETDVRILESRITSLQDTVQSLLAFRNNVESRLPEAAWLQGQLQDTAAQQRDHVESRSADLRALIDSLRARVERAEQQCARIGAETNEQAQRLQQQLRVQVDTALDQVRRATLEATRDVAGAVEKVSETIRGEVRASRASTDSTIQSLTRVTDEALTRVEELKRELNAVVTGGDARMSELENVLRAEVSTRTRTHAESHTWVVASQASLADQLSKTQDAWISECHNLSNRLVEVETAACLERVVSVVSSALEEEHVDKLMQIIEGQNSVLLASSIRQRQQQQQAQQEAKERQKENAARLQRQAEREEDLARQEKALEARARELAQAFQNELRQVEVQRATTDKKKDHLATRTSEAVEMLQVRTAMDALLTQVELQVQRWDEAITTDRMLEHITSSSRETLEIAEQVVRTESSRVLRAADAAIDLVLQRMDNKLSDTELVAATHLTMESMLLRLENRDAITKESFDRQKAIDQVATETKEQVTAQALASATGLSGAVTLSQQALEAAKEAKNTASAVNGTIEDKLNSLSQNLGDALSVATTESRREMRGLSDRLNKVDERLLQLDVRVEDIDARLESRGEYRGDNSSETEIKKLSARMDEVVTFTKQLETDLSEAVLSVQEDVNQQAQAAKEELGHITAKLLPLEERVATLSKSAKSDNLDSLSELRQNHELLSQRLDATLELVDEQTTKQMQTAETVRGHGLELKSLQSQAVAYDRRITALEQASEASPRQSPQTPKPLKNPTKERDYPSSPDEF